MSNYRLIDFNVKALGELPRYVFHAAGKKFQDVRIDSNDWLNLKKEAPFGQLPILEVHNGNNVLRIAQSNTITRYLSRQFGLAGKNEIEQVKAEMILEYFTDLHVIWRVGHKETNDELKKEKFKQFAENTLPNHLNLLEKILKAQNTQYLVSNELTGMSEKNDKTIIKIN